jgi:hypothetical protein
MARVLRWRNLAILFIVDDVLYVLSAATIDNKHHAGAASTIFLALFLIGAVALLVGLVAAWMRSRGATSRRSPG